MEDERVNRKFTGMWIPKWLYLNIELSWAEKILLLEINSLDIDPDKGCFATNEYLAKFLGVSETRVAHMLTDLKKAGWVTQLWFDGRNRGLTTKLRDLSDHDKAALSQMTKLLCHNGQGSTVKNDKGISNTVRNTDKEPLSHGRREMVLVNDDLGERIDEMIVWLKNKRSMHHLSPQSYHDLFAELEKYGITLGRFKEYYEWLEKQTWVKGAIGVKLLGSENSIESYLNREKLAARAAEGEKNGKRNGGGYATGRAILERRKAG